MIYHMYLYLQTSDWDFSLKVLFHYIFKECEILIQYRCHTGKTSSFVSPIPCSVSKILHCFCTTFQCDIHRRMSNQGVSSVPVPMSNQQRWRQSHLTWIHAKQFKYHVVMVEFGPTGLANVGFPHVEILYVQTSVF